MLISPECNKCCFFFFFSPREDQQIASDVRGTFLSWFNEAALDDWGDNSF